MVEFIEDISTITNGGPTGGFYKGYISIPKKRPDGTTYLEDVYYYFGSGGIDRYVEYIGPNSRTGGRRTRNKRKSRKQRGRSGRSHKRYFLNKWYADHIAAGNA